MGTGPYAVDVVAARQGDRASSRTPRYWDTEQPGWVDAVDLHHLRRRRVHVGAISRRASSTARRSPPSRSPRWRRAQGHRRHVDGRLLAGRGPLLRRHEHDRPDARGQPRPAQGGLPVGRRPDGGRRRQPGRGRGRPPATCRPASRGTRTRQNPYPYDLEGATSAVTTMGGVPTLDYWYDINEDHRRIAETLVTGWSQAGLTVKASDYEWGTFLDKLSRGNKGSGSQLFRVAWIADYPSMDAFLYPLVPVRPVAVRAATRSTPTRAWTSCCRRRARPWTASSATTCTRRPRSSSSPTCRPCRCTSTATSASSAPRVHGFAVDPMGTTDMRALWLE